MENVLPWERGAEARRRTGEQTRQALLEFLDECNYAKTLDIQQRFGITERTVYRQVRELMAIGMVSEDWTNGPRGTRVRIWRITPAGKTAAAA